VVNLVLSAGKGLAGYFGHSSAMMCDAAHSFSDLISDALTLFALRMGSLPPDQDHPYGHGRFEAIGSLTIGWLLVVAGGTFGSTALSAIRAPSTLAPRPIALIAAVVSVAAKELLFRSTRTVARKLNSEVVMANAWHHRSDALTSLVAIVGVGCTLLGGWRILDPICGLLVAVLVGCMGGQIMMESLYRLSDTADVDTTQLIRREAEGVDGVLGVGSARCRWMSSSVAVADLSVLIGPLTSASAAQKLAGKVQAAVMAAKPELSEVLVRTQTMCPLLDATTPAPKDAEVHACVENVLRLQMPMVTAAPSVTVRYINGGELAVDVGIDVASAHNGVSVGELRGLASEARGKLLDEIDMLQHVTISCEL